MGGVATPELAAAVAEAGALGMVNLTMVPAEDVALALDALTKTTTGAVAGTIEVTGFGSNPGNLRMFKYVPNLRATPALVVALHGCQQQASAYDDETGWTKLAEWKNDKAA